jgi:hypothetical protein
MLLDAAVVTLIIGLLAGRGKLARLKDLDLRAPALFILAATVKIATAAAGARGVAVAAEAGPPANIVSYLLVLLGLWANRHLWAMRVVGIGVLLNFLVIFANGGSMPVDRALARRSGNAGLVRLLDQPSYVGHKPVTEWTRLRPLADVLPLPMLFPRPKWWSPGSIGDAIITVGTCWLILGAMGAFGLRTKATSAQLQETEAESERR